MEILKWGQGELAAVNTFPLVKVIFDKEYRVYKGTLHAWLDTENDSVSYLDSGHGREDIGLSIFGRSSIGVNQLGRKPTLCRIWFRGRELIFHLEEMLQLSHIRQSSAQNEHLICFA